MGSEEPLAISYVTEKWWHRLLRVLMYGSTFLLLLIGGAYFISAAEYYSYSYSFEPDYVSVDGEDRTCSASDYSDSVYCGELTTSDKFIAHFLAIKGNESLPIGKGTIAGFVQGLQDKGHTNTVIAREFKEEKLYLSPGTPLGL